LVGASSTRSLLGALAGVGALMLGLAPAAAPQDPPPPPPSSVVCITSFKPPEGAYRYKPSACVFHQQGEFPIDGASTTTTKRLRWRTWTETEARAVGKILISTVGPGRLRLRLSEPRAPCGTTVFTKARFRYKLTFEGETYRDGGQIRIDDCLP